LQQLGLHSVCMKIGGGFRAADPKAKKEAAACGLFTTTVPSFAVCGGVTFAVLPLHGQHVGGGNVGIAFSSHFAALSQNMLQNSLLSMLSGAGLPQPVMWGWRDQTSCGLHFSGRKFGSSQAVHPRPLLF